MSNQSVEDAIRRILSRRGNSAPGMCPDENEFAAYLEARLTPVERARFEEHACDCSACRRTLALSLTLANEERSAIEAGSPRPTRTYYSSLHLRLAMGAVFALTVGLLLFQATKNSGLFAPKPRIAGLPAQPGISGGAGAKLQSRQAEKETMIPAQESPLARSKEITAPSGTERRAPLSPPEPRPVPAAAPAPEPALAELARPQATARPEAAKVAVAEPKEEVFKARQTQADTSLLKMAAANLDEKKMQAGVGGRQDANPPRNEAVQAALLQAAAEAQQAQPAKIAGANPVQQAPAEAQQAQPAKIASTDPVQQALAEARQAWSRDAAADSKAKLQSVKKIGARIFYRTASYWVDAECARHDDSPQREIVRDSKAYADMLVQEPVLAGLPADAPVLLYWNGAICLIRPGAIKRPEGLAAATRIPHCSGMHFDLCTGS